jgi:hypothetical protein
MLVDFKYNTAKPNIFTCKSDGASNFWNGILWAASVAKMGYRWKVGNDCKIRFWEDVWIGTSSLAIQYWELYCLINEHNRSIAELCDVDNLKCTFRRCVDVRLFNLWEEVVSIADEEVVSIAEPSVNFTPEKDELIWQFQSSRVSSTRSLYGVINFRGVIPVFPPCSVETPNSP